MQLNGRRRRDHGGGAHSPPDVILVTLDDPNHNTRPTNRIADAHRYQASSIATRMLMNTDSARTSHSCGSNLLDAGAALDEAQDILGHMHPSSTRVYLHPDPARLRAAVDRVPSPRVRPGVTS